MTQTARLAIFGEALMDCFSPDQTLLGGAPFNVAWHLQALGEHPLLISRVGNDDFGAQIREALASWNMSLAGVQNDPQQPTGQVDIKLKGGEPSYTIHAPAAYDFIDKAQLPAVRSDAIVYHGSLALRHHVSRDALKFLTQPAAVSVFIDVNLREPYWEKETVFLMLERARWAKMNVDELNALGFNSADIEQDMQRLQAHFQLEHLIVTRGEAGALVRTNRGEVFEQKPTQAARLKDSVGAGDAFSAMYLKGLIQGWPIQQILFRAQQLASAIVDLQGAISHDNAFYLPHQYS